MKSTASTQGGFFSPTRLRKAKMTHRTAAVFFFSLSCNVFLIRASPAIYSIHAEEATVQEPQKSVERHFELSDIYQPPTEEEQLKINQFDPKRLNYTALRIALDDWLNSTSDRSGRFLGGYKLPGFLSGLTKMVDFDTVIKEIETSIMTSVSCNACKGAVGFLHHYLETGKSKQEIINAISRLCTSFKVETPRVCYGMMNLMIDEVVYVIENVYMTADEICGFVIGDICGAPFNPHHDWLVSFPPIPKPPIKPMNLQQDSTPLKVLHISDTHFDPEYLEGSNADCSEPLCCRASSGVPESPKQAAGPWGDYGKCDTPERTIYSMFEHISYVHPDIDYILWTGDLPPHDVWNQSKASNTHILKESVQQFLTYFPNTPIFPSLGNHESAPVNSFPPSYVPEEFGVDWLYKACHDEWLRWLPKETGVTILKGGFYSVLVRPNFRILSVNTNFCNNKNWWLLVNSTDPAQELQWMIYELQGAEMRGEKVHIIGHIPPGHVDCLKVWSRNFYSIVNRFESTISAQFYGHTHVDEYEIFFDERDPRRAINIAYIAPSVTSYYGVNPGYRIYTVEGDFPRSDKTVLDHETWIMNLEEANAVGRPNWFQLYSARQAYGLRSLHPQEWDNLIYRMSDDDDLFDMYHRLYWKNSPVREKCNSECKKRLLCDLKSARSRDRKNTCATINERVEAKERRSWGGWIFSGITVTSLATWWLWG